MTDEQAQRDDDAAWLADGERNGWILPPRAAWPLRLPVIRHVRAMVLDYRVSRRVEEWASAGLGTGSMNQRDAWIIYAVARGWC